MIKTANELPVESSNTPAGDHVLPDNVGSGAGTPPPTPPTQSPDPFDPFDPENLRIDQSSLDQGVAKKLLTTVPVGKPDKQGFIRVHPGADYRLNVALIEMKEDRETFLVLPSVRLQLNEGEYHYATIHLYVTRQNVVGLWPVKLPAPDGRKNNWHTSAAEAAEMGMKGWIRVAANMVLGANEIYEAVGKFPEPVWPNKTMRELLSIGFKGRLIENGDHPVIQRLRGII